MTEYQKVERWILFIILQMLKGMRINKRNLS